jgi:hypothetical protein
MSYDSEDDTREHIRQVALRLKKVETELRDRGTFHDASKLGPNEKPIFDEVTPRLKGLVYGSDEYRASLKELGPALDHHYANNSHHPEHYPNGIAGMDLLDLIEMYCDWAAATLRTKDGDMAHGIEINIKRFEIDGPLAEILRNTWRRHGGFCGYQNYFLDDGKDVDGTWTTETDIGTGQTFRRQPKPNQPIERPKPYYAIA